MAYTTIDDPSAYFQTKIYTGTGNELVITNDGNSDLQPDFIWIKNRTDASTNHHAVNTSIGSTRNLFVNKTDYEEGQAQSVKSIQSDGFTLGTWDGDNINAKNFVAWQWKANGGTTASNTDGTVTTTTQVNSDAGFSIVTWAGGGTGTLGHGLGETPDMWIIKNRDYAVSWAVGFSDSNILGGRSKYLSLNTTGTISTYNNFWGTSDGQISSTTIGAAGDRTINISGNNYVGYFFKAKQGYSKFGKYVGNGNASGAFVYTGFKPAWLMIKDIGAAGNWFITDHKRNPFNLTDDWLVANGSGAETNYVNASSVDYLSNGFKLRTTYSEANTSGRTYVYFAFAENPFTTSTGIPTTAR